MRTIDKSRNAFGWRLALAVAGIGALISMTAPATAQELVLGEEKTWPGVVFIFEAAVRDNVQPAAQHLAEDLTDIHMEARVNWDTDETAIPPGTPPGGFVPYLNMSAQITNEMTGKQSFVPLVPHINLIDSVHYAYNMALPGESSDLYTVKVFVNPPDPFTLATHRDWRNRYGPWLLPAQIFTYRNVAFGEIVNAPPRASAFEQPTAGTGLAEQ